MSFSLLYQAPVFLVAWSAGRIPGAGAALATASLWVAAEAAGGRAYSRA